MFSHKSSVSTTEKSSLRSIYDKFQSFLSRSPSVTETQPLETIVSAGGCTMATEESFTTPVSSASDLMSMSPRSDQPDITGDLLTGSEFDSICDVTMQEMPANDDNIFIDATSLDYLVKCAESNSAHNNIDRGKESLFVKFDPLYSRKLNHSHPNLTEPAGGDSNDIDGGYETGSTTASAFTEATPKHSLSAGSVHSLNARDKPMQVVPPVVKSELKISTQQTRATPALVRSVSAILTPTSVATERLISISGSTPPTAAPRSPRYHNYSSHQVDRLQSLRVILQKQDQQMLALRQENIDLKSQLQDSEHKLSKTNELENKVKKLMEEKENMLDREHKLLQLVNEKILSNKQMSIVMEEYEKTLSSLIGEQQREKTMFHETLDKLTMERDEALNHLSSMESSFNDLLSKYEKCKTILLDVKDREKLYEQKISEYEDGMQKYETLYNDLKRVTSDSLAKANETLDSLKKSHSIEVTKLNAVIKKHDITIASLQESLVQKTRDNEELTQICDQLINEVR